MRVKLLKLKANEAISSGATEIISSGRTTVRKACKPLAPSTNAASLRSPGMAVSAPVQTSRK